MLDRHAIRLALLAVALLSAFTTTASAQRNTYDDRAAPQGKFGAELQKPQQKAPRNTAGQFDYYALVLSWSPTYCSSNDRPGPDPQCDRRDGRRFAFVLHGMWPQYDRGYPEFCPIRGRPFVPQNVIDGMLDIMPSPRLAIHEYKKHGTCSGLDPAGYYTQARKLFGAIRIPERFVNPFENQMVSPAELSAEFVKANPGLKPDMLAISCGGAGNRLREVRICFNKEGTAPVACGRNEDQRRMCSALKMFVPPVRSHGQGPDKPADRRTDDRSSPLPGPRLATAQRSP
ncbi:MAG: ribonuclease T2 [Hyphomicrobium sp.]